MENKYTFTDIIGRPHHGIQYTKKSYHNKKKMLFWRKGSIFQMRAMYYSVESVYNC